MSNGNYDPLTPLVISDTNLSHAWARSLWYVFKNPGDEIKPLVVSITGFDEDGMPNEDGDIRAALDVFLKAHGKWNVEIVAFTIFPQRYWQIAGGDRERLYEIYMDAFPRLQAKNRRENGRGLYFERLINYGRGPCEGNQLKFIINEYLTRGRRRSKFQASVCDPERDQNSLPRQIFPCLQQVSFVPTDDGLVLNAFYAMQYLVQRGYGNFLGLAHLGAFMAHEMGLDLAQVNVMAGIEKLEFPKRDVGNLVNLVGQKVPNLEPAA